METSYHVLEDIAGAWRTRKSKPVGLLALATYTDLDEARVAEVEFDKHYRREVRIERGLIRRIS